MAFSGFSIISLNCLWRGDKDRLATSEHQKIFILRVLCSSVFQDVGVFRREIKRAAFERPSGYYGFREATVSQASGLARGEQSQYDRRPQCLFTTAGR